MFKYLILVATFIPAIFATQGLMQCTAGHEGPLEVIVEGCDQAPCDIQLGSEAVMRVTFYACEYRIKKIQIPDKVLIFFLLPQTEISLRSDQEPLLSLVPSQFHTNSHQTLLTMPAITSKPLNVLLQLVLRSSTSSASLLDRTIPQQTTSRLNSRLWKAMILSIVSVYLSMLSIKTFSQIL